MNSHMCSCQPNKSEEEDSNCEGNVSEEDDIIIDACCDSENNNDIIISSGPTSANPFPWMVKFEQMCCKAIFEPTFEGLDELMKYYVQYVSVFLSCSFLSI